MEKASSSRLSSALAGGDDTIIARATGEGGGALAIIRLSGPDTTGICRSLCPTLDFEHPRRAQLVDIVDSEGEKLERGVVTFFRAPKTFTGEDLVELVVHGSPWLTGEIVAAGVNLGARHATPGEFTRRAVANGKMDLVQAEGINDLIRAETARQARLARRQVHGALSREVGALRRALVDLRARVEASLDFVEQGVVFEQDDYAERLGECRAAAEKLLASHACGERVRNGVRVVIAGPPNSGKSTLFNALLRRDRAIVTGRPGTTRDLLEGGLEIGGVPVVLVDTAGLRETDDPIELEGVHRAETAVAGADLVLLLRAADAAPTWAAPAGAEGDRLLRVVSKSDLPATRPTSPGAVPVSCVSVGGLVALEEALEALVLEPLRAVESEIAINQRHRDALGRALLNLQRCNDVPRELAAEELAQACGVLEEILGEVDEESVLDAVFSSFCLGK